MNAFRVYEPDECGKDGYPLAWHKIDGRDGVKLIVKKAAGKRCVRCGHPYRAGQSNGEWSRCDERCTHAGPARFLTAEGDWVDVLPKESKLPINEALEFLKATGMPKVIEAQWRILTVHHLNGVKADLRWWNLAALCQRCHLRIQGTVLLERVWAWEHSDWFKPYAAGWYAHAYLGEDLTREQTTARLDDLLSLELAA